MILGNLTMKKVLAKSMVCMFCAFQLKNNAENGNLRIIKLLMLILPKFLTTKLEYCWLVEQGPVQN